MERIKKLAKALEVAIECIEDCEYAHYKVPNSRIEEAVNYWYEYAKTNDVDNLLKSCMKEGNEE